MKRRDFIKGSLAVVAGTAVGVQASALTLDPLSKRSNFPTPFLRRSGKHFDKVMVLGFDGMDPGLTTTMLNDGELPNFAKLRAKGHFGPLQTTLPPQSPVAWSSFISGTNPGGHGIFDFIHRDPKTRAPFLSTSMSVPGGRTFDLGKYSIPLGSGSVDLMRRGTPFWSHLEKNNIPSLIFALPGNFPVVPDGNVRALSGMGTPDLLGGYGTYTFFSERSVPGSRDFTGGRVVRVSMRSHRFSSEILGPPNPFLKGNPPSSVPIDVYRDPVNDVVRVDLGGTSIVLRQGEWSDWVPLSFEFAPLLGSAHGMVRLYAKQIHGGFLMYVTAVNMDPMNPAMPICSPEGYSRELAEKVGRFYTMGLPADTKALNEGVLSSEDFFAQSQLVLHENMAAFEFELNRFNEGCFVFYFSSVDQNSHMLWRYMDKNHLQYDDTASKELKGAVRFYYREMDRALGRAMEKMDSRTLLMAVSDHGFTTFNREIHLTTWLYENGYISLTRPDRMEDQRFFDFVDWEKTIAYPLGINLLYVNVQGRENQGAVKPENVASVKADLIKKLESIVDPLTGQRVVSKAYDAYASYRGPYMEFAPDIVVGYEKGYRISDEAILGQFRKETFGNRTKAWSADHCMDPVGLPGLVLCSQPVRGGASASPGLWDMAPTILAAFGLKTPDEMEGSSVLI
jgi:predicted AlkP superfamily phosphohydrolase/phosphomutase